MKLLTIFLLLLLFTNCAPKESYQGNSEEDKYPSPYIPASPVVYSADYQSYAGVTFELDAASSILIGLPAPTGSYQYSLTTSPSWLSINSSTGMISGNPEGQGLENFQVRATDSGDSQNVHTSSLLTLAINGDPLKAYQWHLNNTGQDSFALTGGSSGIDINVDSVILSGLNGEGVNVAISDSGGEINHDDLYENIIDNASKDYTLDSPYLGNPIATTAHGTAVAGIIASRGWNNIGGAGVAPKAGIAIFQFLESAQTASILIDQASGNFDIFNYSYGDTLYFDTLSDADYLDHLRYQYTNGRGGKGALYFKAAGNEYVQYDDYDTPSVCASHNANFPFENESPFLVVIGAINADGERASYSNTGSNLWVSAPGGEYGFNYPAIVTTDLPTCFKGYSKAASFLYNDFEYGHFLNEKCNYTSVMNGTSSAAPVVSGAAALILEANPNLTAREVKHILAMSAVQVDSGMSNNGYGTTHPSTSEAGCPSLALSSHTYEQGWVTNNAGVKFSNAYGFGLIDVQASVNMAQNFSLDPLGLLPLPSLVETNANFSSSSYSSGALSKSIPDNSATGVTDTITVTSSLTIETVQVKVQVTHPRSGQIGVELTSPRGTKSILMNVNNSFLIDNDNNLNIVLTTNAFYGESANDGSASGQWELKVIDGLSGSTGQLTRWDLNILGH